MVRTNDTRYEGVILISLYSTRAQISNRLNFLSLSIPFFHHTQKNSTAENPNFHSIFSLLVLLARLYCQMSLALSELYKSLIFRQHFRTIYPEKSIYFINWENFHHPHEIMIRTLWMLSIEWGKFRSTRETRSIKLGEGMEDIGKWGRKCADPLYDYAVCMLCSVSHAWKILCLIYSLMKKNVRRAGKKATISMEIESSNFILMRISQLELICSAWMRKRLDEYLCSGETVTVGVSLGLNVRFSLICVINWRFN